jgi:hypothetical protein
VAREELDSPQRQCTPSPSTSRSSVSRQPQHVIASAPALLARFSSCRLLPSPRRWRCNWKVAVFTPLSRSSANRRLPHTRVHKNTNITTRDVSWHTALLTLKVKTASGTLCCNLLARYRANPETFWYTLVLPPSFC